MTAQHLQSTVALHNGVQMPWFGLGVFKVEEGAELIEAVKKAIQHGYRSIDTAAIYGNESGVGQAIAEALKENNLKLPDIQKVIAGMEPLEGANEFLDALRELSEVIILSDTFTQFAGPLIKKLGSPTLFCNTLDIDEDNSVTGYTLRIDDGKRKSVEAFNSIGFEVVASGDSYNDLSMLKTAAPDLFYPENKTSPFSDNIDIGCCIH